MIDRILECVTIAAMSIFIIGGVGFVLWWALECIKISSAIKKMPIWKCSSCEDTLKSETQPYCKACSHIDRTNKKMDRIK